MWTHSWFLCHHLLNTVLEATTPNPDQFVRVVVTNFRAHGVCRDIFDKDCVYYLSHKNLTSILISYVRRLWKHPSGVHLVWKASQKRRSLLQNVKKCACKWIMEQCVNHQNLYSTGNPSKNGIKENWFVGMMRLMRCWRAVKIIAYLNTWCLQIVSAYNLVA